ncbi:hypothetical protein ACFZB2_40700 [Streptomyces bobili]|uniref:hypothetical protein n=1 Tax=Streptomyces bobili TaxID=67280 RepID=UPI0036E2E96F
MRLLTALAALALPADAEGVPLGEAGGTLALPLQEAVEALPAADESRAGYIRTSFKHWTDADKDQCNTRQEVLLAEAFLAPGQGARCALSGGEWYSPYDDIYVDAAGGLDVDHMVPLAEAWDSGAGEWSAREREA